MSITSEVLAAIKRLTMPWAPWPSIVERDVHWSTVLNATHELWVYLPPSYRSQPSKRYPVLYLLHGYGDNSRSWIRRGPIGTIAHDLIARGEAAEMIIVTPSCYANPVILKRLEYAFCSDADLEANNSMFTQLLLSEVRPRIEKRYRALANSESRAIAGFSMGGALALAVGTRHARDFSWVGAFAAPEVPGGLPRHISHGARLFSQPQQIWLGCGSEDAFLPENMKLEAALRDNGYSATLVVVAGAGHNWLTWRHNVAKFLSVIFQVPRP